MEVLTDRMSAKSILARAKLRAFFKVACGLSQEALPVDAGIDRTYVSRLERGLENPTVAVLEKLAKATNAPITELLLPLSEATSASWREKAFQIEAGCQRSGPANRASDCAPAQTDPTRPSCHQVYVIEPPRLRHFLE
jgi:transcriptional regulator with XRE-family HTH domain